MNTEKAKVPDDTAMNWQAIDIFLFSNGQQYTPPRKYHLRNEELDWWKTTLSFLAREHYGSMHSVIDLYTIDGHKVEGPLELSNGNAYVAVTPPDSFIDSGYNKYLIKATRSWEKRQARKSNSLELTVAENIETKQSTSDFENQNVLVNTSAVEAVLTNKHEDQLNVNSRPLSHSPQTPRRNTPTSIKTTEIKRPSIQRNSMLRKKSNSITSPPTNRKSSLKPNDVTLRRNSKGPFKTNDQLPANNKSKDTANSQIVIKTLNNVKETKPTLVDTTTNEGSAEIPISPVTKVRTLNHKSSLTDNSQIENVIDDKDIIVVTNIYRHSRGESSSVVADEMGNSVLFQNPINNLPTDIEERTLRPQSVNLDTTSLPKINSPVKIIDAPETEYPPKNVIEPKEVARGHYLAFINKGDVVNLKLRIEIRDREGVVCPNLEKNIHISYSYTNIKTKIDSRINIEDEIVVKSASLQSLLAKEFLNGGDTDGNCKIVIVKCACCDQYKENLTQSVDMDKTDVIVLPKVIQEDSITRCHCQQELFNKKAELTEEQNKPQINMQSVIYPIKKTCSDISIETLAKIKHKEDSGKSLSKIGSKMLIHSEKNQRTEYENGLEERKVTLTDHEESKIKHIDDDYNYDPKIEETELFVVKNDEMVALLNNVMDKFTQTEWCSIVLEARRHDDGHYSFHLPPLNVLRSYYQPY